MSMAETVDGMEAIVLAGGFGTRLQPVVSDVPKPMAPMDAAGTPFLAYLLQDLSRQGVMRVVLSIGYMGELIQRYFGDEFAGMEICYAIEESPLGTGGAVKAALLMCESPDVFVLNGDTFFAVDLVAMMAQHQSSGADFTLAAREMRDFDRYGTLDLAADGRVLSFREKMFCRCGYINGGVYCMSSSVQKELPDGRFSLEQDFMEKMVREIQMYAFISQGYFVDIGIPEDYEKAKFDFGDNSVKIF